MPVRDSSTPPAPARGAPDRDERVVEVSAVGAGMLAWLGVLLPAVTDASIRSSMPVLFWLGMPGYAVVFVAQTFCEGRPPERWLTLAQVILGLALLFVVPDYTLMQVLLVVGVVAAAYQLTLRWTLVLVAVQSLAVWLAGTAWDTAESTYGYIGAIVYGGLQLFAVVMVDSQRKEAAARRELDVLNAQLQERNDELAAAQHRLAEASRSAERLRISRDLHDTVGHQLTALALHLEAAAHLAASTPAEEPVASSRDMARSLLGDVRRVVGQLREEPPDLEAALARLAGSVPRPQVRVAVAPGMPPLSTAQVETVTRCVQECITNAARHADARTLTVDVFAEDDEVIVRAVDDGRGAAVVTDGHGLLGMRERFGSLGGLVTVKTAPGQGFRLVARLPLAGSLVPAELGEPA